MYLLLDENKRVKEIIPDLNPIFPNIPITQRYPADFISKLLHVQDDLKIEEGYKFNEESQTWEYVDPPVVYVSSSEEPTQLDRIEAQVAYTAMMTDTLLEEV